MAKIVWYNIYSFPRLWRGTNLITFDVVGFFLWKNMAKNKLSEPAVPSNPSLYLSEKDLPEIRAWEVGNEYKLCVVVKQRSKTVHGYDKEKNSIHADFEIQSIKAIDGSSSSKDFKEFEKSYKK